VGSEDVGFLYRRFPSYGHPYFGGTSNDIQSPQRHRTDTPLVMENIQYKLSGMNDWQPVKVKWRDAFGGENPWESVSTYDPKECIVTTYGHLWKNCLDHYVTVAGSIISSELPDLETVGDICHVPYDMVLEIESL
jgi:hypothetical protein